MIEINYSLKDSGWAILELNNGHKVVKFDISYLYDSLKKLAESAIELKDKNEKSVIFMDEPGEHWLVLKKQGKKIEYELRWYKEWANWNLINEEKFEIKLTGSSTLTQYINEVRRNLISIYYNFGIEQYKKKWVQHDFPLSEYKKLK